MSENVNAAEAAPETAAPSNAEELLESGNKAKAEKKERESLAAKQERKRSAAAELKDFLAQKDKAEKTEVKADSYTKAEEKAEKDAEAKKEADRKRKAEERAEKKEEKKSADKAKPEAEPKSESGATEDDAPSKTEAKSKTDKVTDAIEAAGEEVPEQRKNESDKNYEVRLARALRDIKDAKAEALSEKNRAKELEAKVKEATEKGEITTKELEKFKSAIEKGKIHPLEAVHDLFGLSLEDLAKWTVNNPDKAKEFTTKAQRKAAMDPELAAKIERLEKAENERQEQIKKLEAEKAEQTKRAQFEEQKKRDVGKVKTYLDDNSDDFPFLSAFGEAAAADVVTRTYGSNKTDALEAMRELENEVASITVNALKSEKAARALLKSNPDLRDALVKVLGVEAAPAKKTETEERPKARTIATKTVSSETTTGGKMTMAERKRAAAAELGEYLKAQRG